MYLKRMGTIAAVAVLYLGQVCAAQFTGYGFGGQVLLTEPTVQDDLKLNSEQKTKLKSVADKLREEWAENKDKIEKMTPEERGKLAKETSKKTNDAIVGVLDEKQVKRLKQIDLQDRGPLALFDPEVRKALDVTDDQIGQVKSLVKDSLPDMEKAYKAGDRTKLDELVKSAREKFQKIFTKEQKTKWAEMTGEPLKLS
jgi:hypothetical protein